MKQLNKYTKDFFDKYKEKPEDLFEYGPEIQLLADKYVQKIEKLLGGMVDVSMIGSVAYKIPFADLEIAVYPSEEVFLKTIGILSNEFGKHVQEQPEFVRFQINTEKYETDIHVYGGYEALVSKSLTKYMLDHPGLIEEYKMLKEKFNYSKREYQYQKYLFINRVIEIISDNYME